MKKFANLAEKQLYYRNACKSRSERIELEAQWCAESIDEALQQMPSDEYASNINDAIYEAIIEALESTYSAGRNSWLPIWLSRFLKGIIN